jgi:hypothetical protein
MKAKELSGILLNLICFSAAVHEFCRPGPTLATRPQQQRLGRHSDSRLSGPKKPMVRSIIAPSVAADRKLTI